MFCFCKSYFYFFQSPSPTPFSIFHKPKILYSSDTFNDPCFEQFRDAFSADEIRPDFPCEGVAPPSRTCEARENRGLVHRSVIPFKEGH